MLNAVHSTSFYEFEMTYCISMWKSWIIQLCFPRYYCFSLIWQMLKSIDKNDSECHENHHCAWAQHWASWATSERCNLPKWPKSFSKIVDMRTDARIVILFVCYMFYNVSSSSFQTCLNMSLQANFPVKFMYVCENKHFLTFFCQLLRASSLIYNL